MKRIVHEDKRIVHEDILLELWNKLFVREKYDIAHLDNISGPRPDAM